MLPFVHLDFAVIVTPVMSECCNVWASSSIPSALDTTEAVLLIGSSFISLVLSSPLSLFDEGHLVLARAFCIVLGSASRQLLFTIKYIRQFPRLALEQIHPSAIVSLL